jgi:hypothetical protein
MRVDARESGDVSGPLGGGWQPEQPATPPPGTMKQQGTGGGWSGAELKTLIQEPEPRPSVSSSSFASPPASLKNGSSSTAPGETAVLRRHATVDRAMRRGPSSGDTTLTRTFVLARIAAAATALTVGAVPQPPQHVPPVPLFRSGVNLVTVDASVLDRDRRTVRGLTAADFTILENGQPQPVTAFTAIDLPDARPRDAESAASPGPRRRGRAITACLRVRAARASAPAVASRPGRPGKRPQRRPRRAMRLLTARANA